MPIYGYACQECGHTLDELQKMSDAPLVDCPDCGEPALKRQLSAPRFRLKGSGWYETDFKSDNQRNIAGEKDAAKSDDKSDSKSDGKGDSKSDGKSDSGDSGKKADKTEAKTTAASSESKAKPAKKSSADKPSAA